MANTQPQARDVTDAEIAVYREQGWARLDDFISPQFAAELLAGVTETMGEVDAERERIEMNALRDHKRGGRPMDAVYWRDYHFIARDDRREPFYSFVFGEQLGHNAQRLMGRKVGVRYHQDLVAAKQPRGEAIGSGATLWHQDFPTLPFDRGGSLAFWIALDDVPAERGAMRFLNRSHHAGPLGRNLGKKVDLLEWYPDLAKQYELSNPLDLKAGDATVHNALCVHFAPENTTDQVRWAYIIAYFPADALYTGAQNHNFDSIGLEVNQPLEHANFPVVYSP